MILFLVILIVGSLVAFFLFKLNKKANVNEINRQSNLEIKQPDKNDEEDEEQIFIDEKGKEYKIVDRVRSIPRRTFILGELSGKYWGEFDFSKEHEFQKLKFYDFNIYEVEVKVSPLKSGCYCTNRGKENCNGVHTESEGRFEFVPDSNFSKKQLPSQIPCSVVIEGNSIQYAVAIHEPQVRQVKFNRKLHQDEGHEVFGTIGAEITGYILDFKYERYQEKQFINEIVQPVETVESKLNSNNPPVPTGNIEFNDGYQRTEFYNSDLKGTNWGDWKYTKTANSTTSEGCLSAAFGSVGFIIGAIFLILLLPQILIIVPFLLILFAIRIVPSFFWTSVLRIIGAVIFLAFLINGIQTFSNSSTPTVTNVHPKVKYKSPEPQLIGLTDSANVDSVKDTLIRHFRRWEGFSGKNYEGYFSVRKSDLISSGEFKNNLDVPGNNQRSYDEIVFRLKDNDVNKLDSFYFLFDSLKVANKLTEVEFSEVILSFVQSIPYSVVLQDACDANLYNDDFIRKYLNSDNAICEEYERFGIKTPVQFLATMNGDCDTRTLFLYLVLSHYNYDVILLSSEFYKHSLIGINLPFDGADFYSESKRYVMCETTSAGIKPGILPEQISNINYWRVSLKSK